MNQGNDQPNQSEKPDSRSLLERILDMPQNIDEKNSDGLRISWNHDEKAWRELISKPFSGANSIYSYDRPQRYHSEDPAPKCRKFPVLTRSFATRVRISRRRGPGFRAFRSFFDMRDPQEADCGSRNRCPAKKNCSGEHF